jgi:hypothetical protein
MEQSNQYECCQRQRKMKLTIYQQKESLGVHLLNVEITNTVNVSTRKNVLILFVAYLNIPNESCWGNVRFMWSCALCFPLYKLMGTYTWFCVQIHLMKQFKPSFHSVTVGTTVCSISSLTSLPFILSKPQHMFDAYLSCQFYRVLPLGQNM